MGLGSIFKTLFGGGETPKTSAAPVQETEEEKRKAKKSRVPLYETEGGVVGQELTPDQVQKRDNIFGN